MCHPCLFYFQWCSMFDGPSCPIRFCTVVVSYTHTHAHTTLHRVPVPSFACANRARFDCIGWLAFDGKMSMSCLPFGILYFSMLVYFLFFAKKKINFVPYWMWNNKRGAVAIGTRGDESKCTTKGESTNTHNSLNIFHTANCFRTLEWMPLAV